MNLRTCDVNGANGCLTLKHDSREIVRYVAFVSHTVLNTTREKRTEFRLDHQAQGERREMKEKYLRDLELLVEEQATQIKALRTKLTVRGVPV